MIYTQSDIRYDNIPYDTIKQCTFGFPFFSAGIKFSDLVVVTHMYCYIGFHILPCMHVGGYLRLKKSTSPLSAVGPRANNNSTHFLKNLPYSLLFERYDFINHIIPSKKNESTNRHICTVTMVTEDVTKDIQTCGKVLDELVCNGDCDRNRLRHDDRIAAEKNGSPCITVTKDAPSSKVLKVDIPRGNKRILYLIIFGSLVLVVLVGVKFGVGKLNGKSGESPMAFEELTYNTDSIDVDDVLNLVDDTTTDSSDNSGVDNDDTTNLPDCEEGIDPIVLATQETNQNSTNNNNSNNQTNGEDNEVIRRKMLRNSSSRKAIVAHSRVRNLASIRKTTLHLIILTLFLRTCRNFPPETELQRSNNNARSRK